MIEANYNPTPQRSWFMTVSMIAFAAMTVFSITFQLQMNGLNSRLDTLKAEKTKLATPFSTSGNMAGASAAASIKNTLVEIEATQLQWSKIIDKIESTIPKAKDGTALVSFTSYTGGENGKFAVNAMTRDDASDPFGDIATVIRTFASEPSFKRFFISSITKSMTSGGAVVLSFSVSFEYIKPTF